MEMEGIPRIALLVLIVVVVAAAILYLNAGSKPSKPKAGNATQNRSASGGSSNLSPPSTQLPLPSPPPKANQTSHNLSTYCVPSNDFVWVGNGNFSTGTYFAWQTTGSGFGSAPLNLSWANYNGVYYQHPWNGYFGNFAATTYSQGRQMTPGTLSSSFVVVEPYLNFQITSPPSSQLYVEILLNNNPVVVNHYDTLQVPNANTLGSFSFASINMTGLLCKSVTVSVVSDVLEVTSSNQNQFIAVGNFFQGRIPYQTPGVIVNGNTLR